MRIIINILIGIYKNVRGTILWLFAVIGGLNLIIDYEISYLVSNIIVLFLLIEGFIVIMNQHKICFKKENRNEN